MGGEGAWIIGGRRGTGRNAGEIDWGRLSFGVHSTDTSDDWYAVCNIRYSVSVCVCARADHRLHGCFILFCPDLDARPGWQRLDGRASPDSGVHWTRSSVFAGADVRRHDERRAWDGYSGDGRWEMGDGEKRRENGEE